jgi:hypothetical protein
MAPDQTTGFDHVGAHSQRDLTLIGRKPEASHEASNIIRNRSRYPSHCCNHHVVVAINFDRASCRRYSHRSVQEFPQPDRSKSFRTIALLMGISLSLKRGSDCLKTPVRGAARSNDRSIDVGAVPASQGRAEIRG